MGNSEPESRTPIDVLRGSSLFSGLDERQLKDLIALTRVKDFAAHETIIREGSEVDEFYLIVDGRVEVRRSADFPPARLGPNEFFGETALVSKSAPSLGVVALQPTRCLVLGSSELRSFPSVTLRLLQELNPSSGRPQHHMVFDKANAAVIPKNSAAAAAPPPSEVGAKVVAVTAIEFKSEKTNKLFEGLVKVFIDDYMVKRKYFEQSGWRSLGEIMTASKLPRSSLYGEHGRYGSSVNELVSRGLIELRVFTGQRGRGGEVVRIRVAYDKDPVKHYVDGFILKRK